MKLTSGTAFSAVLRLSIKSASLIVRGRTNGRSAISITKTLVLDIFSNREVTAILEIERTMDSDSKNEQDDIVIVDEELVDRYPGLEDYLGHRVRLFFDHSGELSGLHCYD